VRGGAYACLCGADLPRTHLTSRIRRDAALYEPAPPRTGKRGRPRTKENRLPTPAELATAAPATDWQPVEVDLRGRAVPRLVLVRDVFWYAVNKRDLLRLVIVRDPAGVEPDDFFVTTDRTASGAEVASRYAGRWSIEVCFHDVKQHVGGEDPQSWKRNGPERAACLSLWLHALTRCWYLDTHPAGRTWIPRPRYRHKNTPASSTPSPCCAVSCGPDELQPCQPREHRTPKSPTHYWTRSPTRHEQTGTCESPLDQTCRETGTPRVSMGDLRRTEKLMVLTMKLNWTCPIERS